MLKETVLSLGMLATGLPNKNKFLMTKERFSTTCNLWRQVGSWRKIHSVYIQTDLPVCFTNIVSFSKLIGSDISCQVCKTISWSQSPEKHGRLGNKEKPMIIWKELVSKGFLLAQFWNKLQIQFSICLSWTEMSSKIVYAGLFIHSNNHS